MVGHPAHEILQKAVWVPDTVLNERRSHHGNLCPGHHALHNVFGTVDTACDCQTWPDGTVENRDPMQAQWKLAGIAQDQMRSGLKILNIEIGLVETVEQHEGVGTSIVETPGHVGHGTEEWGQLDGDWDF